MQDEWESLFPCVFLFQGKIGKDEEVQSVDLSPDYVLLLHSSRLVGCVSTSNLSLLSRATITAFIVEIVGN